MEKLKEKLWEALEEIARKPELKTGDLDLAHKLTDTIKNIDKICALEVGGWYSRDGDWMAEGIYGHGSSYANRGQHFVRGHYSRDGERDKDMGYSSRRDGQERYSRGDGRSEMMQHLEMALDSANEQDREDIKRFMQKLDGSR